MLALLIAASTAAAEPPALRVAGDIAISESRAADGTLTLVHQTVVDAPVEDVWRAISTPEGWREWAVPVARTPEPGVMETSYDPAAQPGGPSTIRHRVVARIPGRLLAFRTIKAPDGFPHFEEFRRTTGTFELEPAGEGRTRVRTIGTGYSDNDVGRKLIGFFREGNRITLERLQRRFREGPVDWAAERASRKTADK